MLDKAIAYMEKVMRAYRVMEAELRRTAAVHNGNLRALAKSKKPGVNAADKKVLRDHIHRDAVETRARARNKCRSAISAAFEDMRQAGTMSSRELARMHYRVTSACRVSNS